MSAMQEALRDAMSRPDGLPTEGAENEQVAGQEAIDQMNARDRHEFTTEPEHTADLERQLLEKMEQQELQIVQSATPWWLEEYFRWERGNNGKLRMVPIPDAIEDIIARIPERLYRAKERFQEEVQPYVADNVEAYQNLDLTDEALFSDDGDVKFRHSSLLRRCIEHFMFAAQTRRELENWQRRLSAQAKERPQTFMDKVGRGEDSAKKGLLLYLTLAQLNSDLLMNFTNTVPGTVKNRLWTRANIETRNLTNPDDQVEQARSEQTVDASMDDIF